MDDTLEQKAAACAAQLPPTAQSFATDCAPLTRYRDVVDAVRNTEARFAFDLAGRPDALAAVRHALPAMEAELLDAILEDVACELAAHQEALYQIAVAARRGR
jgi:hypothetical protein